MKSEHKNEIFFHIFGKNFQEISTFYSLSLILHTHIYTF